MNVFTNYKLKMKIHIKFNTRLHHLIFYKEIIFIKERSH